MSRFLPQRRIEHRLSFEVSGTNPDELDRRAVSVLKQFVGDRALVFAYVIDSDAEVYDLATGAVAVWLGRVSAELWKPPA